MTLGVNYPWRHYGGDFGPSLWGHHRGIAAAPADVAADLHAMAAAGVQVVRWFVFTDARGGVVVDRDGWPTGIHEGAFDDLDALLTLAHEAGVRVVPVLFDHTLAFRATEHAGARLGGHGAMARGPGRARARARLGHRSAGEALWRERIARAPGIRRVRLGPAERARLARRGVVAVEARGTARAVRRLRRVDPRRPSASSDAERQVASRSARRDCGSHRGGTTTALDLDFLQVHAYFDPDHDFDLLRTPYAALGVRRPVLVGECSAQGEAEAPAHARAAVSAAELVRSAHQLGYAGAWPWSWRGVDIHGSIEADAFRDVVRLASAATER